MFAPVALVATSLPQPAAVMALVVVLPLVPLTRITRREVASWSSRSGQMAKPTRPPATVPLPRPLTRESQFTTSTATRATRARSERLGVMVFTLTTRKHKRANRGGGWPFCKTFALLKRGVLRRTGDTHYAGHGRINQQDSIDTCHLYNRCMEIRQLEALVGIADHGTFSSAADVLGTVQSNISNRIARLESELGTELIDRANGVVTESGEIVLLRARRILSELGAIAADVSELNADIRGEVSLGMIGTAGRWIVPLVLEAQRAIYPHVALRIIEGSNSALEPQVVNGQLDLAVLAWPVVARELQEVDLFKEDLALIVDKHHPLAKTEGSVTFETLSQYELMLPLRGTPIRREIDDASRAPGVELRPLIEMDGLRTIASLTFDGHGPTILPATMLSKHLRDQFVAIHIENIAKRRVVLVRRRFGFPAAPVRATHALLTDVVRNAVNVPDGVYNRDLQSLT